MPKKKFYPQFINYHARYQFFLSQMEDETLPHYRKRQLEYLALKYKKLADQQFKERQQEWQSLRQERPYRSKNSEGEQQPIAYSDKYRSNWSNIKKSDRDPSKRQKEAEIKTLRNFYKNNKLPFKSSK